MRAIVLFAASAALAWGGFGWPQPASGAARQDEKKDAKAAPETARQTAAAELTRTTALKAKMSVAFTGARLGDVLKEFAAQADMRADVQILWTYGPGFPFDQKVTYSCKDKPLDVALDELFKKNGGLGYVVVSKEDDRHDGWILVTTNGERGFEKPPPPPATAEEEADAVAKLELAKKLIDAGKNDQAKTVLMFVMKKYPTAKATTEAKELLAKLEK